MTRLRLILTLWLIGAALAGCARSDFSTPATEETIRQALLDRSLQVCAEQPIAWQTVPGFVSGKIFTVSTGCAGSGVNVAVARFDSVEARDSAVSNAQNTSRVSGNRIARTLGPLIITVDNVRDDAVAQRIVEALNATGAR